MIIRCRKQKVRILIVETQVKDFRGVHACIAYLLKVLEVPVFDTFVWRSTSKCKSRRIILQTPNLVLWVVSVLWQVLDYLAWVKLPYKHITLDTSWCNPPTIWRYSYISYCIRMARKVEDRLGIARPCIPNLYGSVLAWCCNDAGLLFVCNTCDSRSMTCQYLRSLLGQIPNIYWSTFGSCKQLLSLDVEGNTACIWCMIGQRL